MSNQTTTDIKSTVWSACDTFRGVIDPSQYKDYILTMLFIKYISDVSKEKRAVYEQKYNGDQERVQRAMQLERFVIPETSQFDYLYERRAAPNIGSLIDIALADLEKANTKKLTSDAGSGVFRNISFNSTNLGDEKDKNARLKQLLIDFSEIDLMPSHLANKDIIGDAYEFLISNFASDAGKKAGEFFTPPEVSLLLARLTKGAEGVKIYDPTCGSGSLLIKAAQQVGSNDVALFGQENNGSTWALSVMNMFLHGFDNASIRWGDTIRNPLHLEEDGTTIQKFDIVVANPPFSLKKWGKDEVDEDIFNRFWRGVPPKNRGDWSFLTHMIESAKENTGVVGVIIPHGVLFRGGGEGTIRKKVIQENLLEAVIGLPNNLFFGTGIPASIIIFRKGRPEDQTDVLFVDASQYFLSGTNQNTLRAEDIDKIVATYKDFRAGKLTQGLCEDKYSYVASLEEIKENDFNLNIPRYVDTFEEEEPVDLSAIQDEINALEVELNEVQQAMSGFLEKLKE